MVYSKIFNIGEGGLAFNLDKIWNTVTVNNFSLTEYNKDWSAEILQLPGKQLGKSLIFFSLKKSKMMENIHSYLIVLLGAWQKLNSISGRFS